MKPPNKHFSEIAGLLRPYYLKIFLMVKAGQPISQADLAKQVKMSYTGLQRHCERLEKLGYLERRRLIPEGVGRPVLGYRLAAKAEVLFPTEVSKTLLELLDVAGHLYGDTAAERLLMSYFQRWREQSSPGLQELSGYERVCRLVELRNQQGHWCEVLGSPEGDEQLGIIEYHNVLSPVFEIYPSALKLERQMLEQLLGSRLERSQPFAGQDTIYFQLVGSAVP